jgi:hypothetical protein
VTPKGVEHIRSPALHCIVEDVSELVTPKGVEHSATPGITPLDFSIQRLRVS